MGKPTFDLLYCERIAHRAVGSHYKGSVKGLGSEFIGV